MDALRRHLAWLVGTLVVLQVCLTVGTPVMLYLDRFSDACTCPEGDGAVCPMHHTITRTDQKPGCAFRGVVNLHTEAIATLLGPPAVLASALCIEHPMPGASVTSMNSPVLTTVSVPDAPPPRV